MTVPFPGLIQLLVWTTCVCFPDIIYSIYNTYIISHCIYIYYIRLYFTVFPLARSNTREIPFPNILISKKKILCNKKSYCTLVQNQWMKLCGTRVQYGFSLHRNCFLLINMLEYFIKFENFKKIWKHKIIKKTNLKFNFFLTNLKISFFF